MEELKRRANKAIERLINEVRRQAFEEVVEMMWEEYNKRDRLLIGGQEIFEQAYGERFDQLFDLRIKVRKSTMTILALITKVNELKK